MDESEVTIERKKEKSSTDRIRLDLLHWWETQDTDPWYEYYYSLQFLVADAVSREGGARNLLPLQ